MEKELKKRIEELEERVDELEDRERKRKIAHIIKICIKVLIIALIIFGIWKAYNYVNDNYIKPLNDIAQNASNITNEVDLSKVAHWNDNL